MGGTALRQVSTRCFTLSSSHSFHCSEVCYSLTYYHVCFPWWTSLLKYMLLCLRKLVSMNSSFNSVFTWGNIISF